MNPLIALAKTALEQSQQMHTLAETSDWDALATLQEPHSKTVNQIMQATAPAEIASELRSILTEVKATNDLTMALADKMKTHLVKEKKTLGQAAKMQKALDAFR